MVSVGTERSSRRSTAVFVSYARRDLDKVAPLVEGLRLLGIEVWLDRSLVGGHSWWDEILSRVSDCDVFVQVVSSAGIESEACSSERPYAQALGKPVVPVIVETVDTALLPTD